MFDTTCSISDSVVAPNEVKTTVSSENLASGSLPRSKIISNKQEDSSEKILLLGEGTQIHF